MNQKTQYELTIAGKLEQLTVPDMVDAVWTRIEAQLDIDLPTDDGPSGPSSPSVGGGGWTGPASFIAITAFIAVLFLSRKNEEPTVAPAWQDLPVIVTPQENQTRNLQGPPGNITIPSLTTPGGQEATQGFRVDSQPGVEQGMVASPGMDTTQSVAGEIVSPVMLPPLTMPDTTQKKSRGVKGIKDDDYRVVPAGRDSS